MPKYAPLLLPVLAIGCHGATIGLFEGHQDVGTVLTPGTASYDASKETYTVSASGENMWATADDFQFVWKKVSGDIRIAADIAFVGQGGDPHRKAVLLIRQSLDADSPYADVAVHGVGLTSLQSREEKGAATHEVQANISGPRRVAIEKRGDYFYAYVAGEGEELRFAGAAMRVPIEGSFYVGFGVCAHNKDAVERAVFSNVRLSAPAGATTAFHTLETVTVASTDRRVVLVSEKPLEQPVWLDDALIYKSEGKYYRVPAAGGSPALSAAAGAAGERSPDGTRVVSLVAGRPSEMIVQVLTIATGRSSTIAKLVGPVDAPAWSPDSKKLVFVSHAVAAPH